MGTTKNSKSTIRLHDGELNVMELLWANGRLTARDISVVIKEYIGWEKNTTYTVIKRLIDKGALKRIDPGFICIPLITKEKVQQIETDALLQQVYDGKITNLIKDYLMFQQLNDEDIETLSDIVQNYRITNYFNKGQTTPNPPSKDNLPEKLNLSFLKHRNSADNSNMQNNYNNNSNNNYNNNSNNNYNNNSNNNYNNNSNNNYTIED